MIKTTRKSFNAIILALAMTLGYMPVVSPAAETEDEIEILAETGSGPGTEQVLREPVEENGPAADDTGLGQEKNGGGFHIQRLCGKAD